MPPTKPMPAINIDCPPSKSPSLLLIAQSARLLAQSAARAGMVAYAIDHFGDVDTCRYAAGCLALAPGDGGFDESELLQAAGQLAPGVPLVYGSGLDTRPDLLEKLAKGRELLGNTPDTLRIAHTPGDFFCLLKDLKIPYPDTRFTPPDPLDGWLVKPGCGEGGKRVGFAATKRPPPDAYYQRYICGNACSALFIANGHAVRVIGFNTQWTAAHDPAQPFLFGGAVNRAALDGTQRNKLVNTITKLVAALGLVGLNSVDFMLDGGEAKILELNPRPSATLALYDEDYALGLLAAHIAACRGELLDYSANGPVRALRIVYAPRAITIGESLAWPEACADIPRAGSSINVGEPLCSVMVQAASQGEAEALLQTKETEFLRGLFGPRD
jgi:predicted ATP-grasp superfamily ATP-dependent carboligase